MFDNPLCYQGNGKPALPKPIEHKLVQPLRRAVSIKI